MIGFKVPFGKKFILSPPLLRDNHWLLHCKRIPKHEGVPWLNIFCLVILVNE
jgi:hypothetical protein